MTLSCGCKGARFCGVCKESDRVKTLQFASAESEQLFEYNCFVFKDGGVFYSPKLNFLSSMDEIYERVMEVRSSQAEDFKLDGITLFEDFLSVEEEAIMVEQIDQAEWVLSQSGRRKQDYGPRVNFKHKKVKVDRFVGVPVYADLVLSRLTSINIDKFGNYRPFELCNLEYERVRQSAIEFHRDDVWIWGERLISLNLLDRSVMTFENREKKFIVFVYMPRRSLLLFGGEARYLWRHGIFSRHIENRRIALTMREPGKDFSENGALFEKYGRDLIERGSRRIPVVKA